MKTKIMMLMFPLLMGTASLNAGTPKRIEIRTTENATEQSKQIAHDLQIRLDKIQTLDYNSLNDDQKIAARKEIKAIKKEARRAEGVYFYVGGGILLAAAIVILLILLL
jgi:hypothetical protein